MRVFFALVAAALVISLTGCSSTEMQWEPVVRVVDMPKSFEDGRIKTNPWRDLDRVHYGPEYPYKLVYQPSSHRFRVVTRKGGSDLSASDITKYSRDAGNFTHVMPVLRLPVKEK